MDHSPHLQMIFPLNFHVFFMKFRDFPIENACLRRPLGKGRICGSCTALESGRAGERGLWWEKKCTPWEKGPNMWIHDIMGYLMEYFFWEDPWNIGQPWLGNPRTKSAEWENHRTNWIFSSPVWLPDGKSSDMNRTICFFALHNLPSGKLT